MTETRTALLMVGSPKGNRSSSRSLGMYLMEQLSECGFAINELHIHKSLNSPEKTDELLQLVKTSDLIVLAFPLYIDSLPAPVMRVMEVISENLKGTDIMKKQFFIAISNSGFPEAHQNMIALDICHCFARKVGFKWAGGLALGMGAMISGLPLDKFGPITRNIKKSIRITADALANEDIIPETAVKLMAKSMMPHRMYWWMGNRRWKHDAKKFGVLESIRDIPHSISD